MNSQRDLLCGSVSRIAATASGRNAMTDVRGTKKRAQSCDNARGRRLSTSSSSRAIETCHSELVLALEYIYIYLYIMKRNFRQGEKQRDSISCKRRETEISLPLSHIHLYRIFHNISQPIVLAHAVQNLQTSHLGMHLGINT